MFFFIVSCSDDSNSNEESIITFSKSLGGPSEEGVSSKVSIDIAHNGGYIISTDTREQGAFYTDMYVTLLNEQGNIEWEKRYNSPNSSSSAEHVIIDPSGGYLVTGSYNGGLASLTKIDNEGTELWSQILNSGEGEKVVIAPDGGYMVYHNSEFTKVMNGGGIDFNIQFDTNGFFPGSDFIATSDGNYLIIGFSPSANTAVLKMDAQGNQLWSKNLNNDDLVGFNSKVTENATGGFTLGTVKYLNNNFTSSNIYIINIDSQGDIINEFEINLETEALYSVLEISKSNDGFYIIGTKSILSGGSGSPISESDILVVKLNNNGELIWEKNYGTVGFDLGYEILETDDGGFIAVGQAESDIYVVKADSDGNVN